MNDKVNEKLSNVSPGSTSTATTTASEPSQNDSDNINDIDEKLESEIEPTNKYEDQDQDQDQNQTQTQTETNETNIITKSTDNDKLSNTSPEKDENIQPVTTESKPQKINMDKQEDQYIIIDNDYDKKSEIEDIEEIESANESANDIQHTDDESIKQSAKEDTPM